MNIQPFIFLSFYSGSFVSTEERRASALHCGVMLPSPSTLLSQVPDGCLCVCVCVGDISGHCFVLAGERGAVNASSVGECVCTVPAAGG